MSDHHVHLAPTSHEQGLQLLAALNDFISSETSEQSLLEAVSPLLQRFAAADHVGFVLVNELTGETFLVAEYPVTPMLGARLPHDKRSLTAYIRRTRNELLIDDVATSKLITPELRAILQGVGAASIALIPMLDGQRNLFGSVGFDYSVPHTLPDETRLTYLRLAVRQLASAVLRLRLQAQYQRQAEQLQKINAFSHRIAPDIPLTNAVRIVLDAARTLEPFDYVAIYLKQSQQELLQRVGLWKQGELHITPEGVATDRIGYTPHHDSFMNENLVLIQDLMADRAWHYPQAVGIRTLVAYPLMRQGGAFGVLEMGSTQPYAYNPASLGIFQQFTNEAALLISSVLAYWQAQSKVELKVRTAELAARLQQQTEMDALVQATLRALTTTFGGSRARIRLGTAVETKGQPS